MEGFGWVLRREGVKKVMEKGCLRGVDRVKVGSGEAEYGEEWVAGERDDV